MNQIDKNCLSYNMTSDDALNLANLLVFFYIHGNLKLKKNLSYKCNNFLNLFFSTKALSFISHFQDFKVFWVLYFD